MSEYEHLFTILLSICISSYLFISSRIYTIIFLNFKEISTLPQIYDIFFGLVYNHLATKECNFI